MQLPRSAVFFVVAVIAGCASMPGMPGHVSVHVSDFDSTREVFMEPAAVPTPGDMVISIQLGAHWTSKAPDTVSLIAQTPRDITTIKSQDGLQFHVDGEVTKLNSSTTLTDHESEVISGSLYTESSRPFTASIEFVRKLAQAETAGVKMLIGQDEYFEARMKSEGMNAGAHRGLNRFLAKVREQKQAMQD